MKKIYKFEIKPNSVYNYHQPIVINAPQGAKPIQIKYVWHFYKKTQDDNELSKMGLLSDYDKYTGKLR